MDRFCCHSLMKATSCRVKNSQIVKTSEEDNLRDPLILSRILPHEMKNYLYYTKTFPSSEQMLIQLLLSNDIYKTVKTWSNPLLSNESILNAFFIFETITGQEIDHNIILSVYMRHPDDTLKERVYEKDMIQSPIPKKEDKWLPQYNYINIRRKVHAAMIAAKDETSRSLVDRINAWYVWICTHNYAYIVQKPYVYDIYSKYKEDRTT